MTINIFHLFHSFNMSGSNNTKQYHQCSALILFRHSLLLLCTKMHCSKNRSIIRHAFTFYFYVNTDAVGKSTEVPVTCFQPHFNGISNTTEGGLTSQLELN